MKDTSSLHQKVQEHCDCFATTDPLKEMSEVPHDADPADAAVKWLALAALHGVNQNARKITIRRSPNGEVRVTAKYREANLPSPGGDVAGKVIDTVRQIGHFEKAKGKLPLALGIRDSSMELTVEVASSDDGDKVTLKFPD